MVGMRAERGEARCGAVVHLEWAGLAPRASALARYPLRYTDSPTSERGEHGRCAISVALRDYRIVYSRGRGRTLRVVYRQWRRSNGDPPLDDEARADGRGT